MNAKSPADIESFRRLVDRFEIGGVVRFFVVILFWIGGLVLHGLCMDWIYGAGTSSDSRATVGAILFLPALAWPWLFIKFYDASTRARRLGLFCPSCDDVFLNSENWKSKILDSGTCPCCDALLFQVAGKDDITSLKTPIIEDANSAKNEEPKQGLSGLWSELLIFALSSLAIFVWIAGMIYAWQTSNKIVFHTIYFAFVCMPGLICVWHAYHGQINDEGFPSPKISQFSRSIWLLGNRVIGDRCLCLVGNQQDVN